ncbi:hypothetical protein [Novipirellula artificiosorum]|uniref:Arylsulfatase n=1 Tax=Novipirellula artificiosorum TaxID=2528016 RepID=A0A5C6D5X4_9BACT|nr:hypothetical protein [Novipirellula artificiosorum]TWU32238.1 hypothetical protein Poly41_57230 [Novipirellula artificiosorum]
MDSALRRSETEGYTVNQQVGRLTKKLREKGLLENTIVYYERSPPIDELYDMEADPGERHNLYESHPEVFQRLLALLESDVNRGRSTEGPDQKNDVERINTRRGMNKR